MICNITVIILLISNSVLAQQENFLSISSVVKNEEGNPVENAEVYSNSNYTKTDASGRFTISIEPGARLVIEAEGFEPISYSSVEAERMDEFNLKEAKSLYGSGENVQLAFRKAPKGNVIGAVSEVKASEVLEYDNYIWANDILTGRTLGMLGSNSIRGVGIGIDVADLTGSGLYSGNALFIVDGLPRDIDGMKASEIESISVLKDINSTILYGSAAVNGVVLITTKRGEAYKSTTNITARQGISKPRTMPNYLNSADYMTYYNQARANDDLSPQFDNETIQNFREGNPYRYPDIDYYSDEYLKSVKPYFDLVSEFSGGDNNAKYYANLGWNSTGGLLNFGEGANARNNVFNARGNVDLRVNDWINTAIDGAAIFSQDKSQRGNYWYNAANIRPHEYSPLLPIDLIDPENSVLLARKNDVNNQYLIGGNSNYQSTPFGDGYSGGVNERIQRKFSFNNRVNFDMDKVTEGLSFHTNISFDYYMRYDQSVLNQYSVYEPTWDEVEDKIIDLKQHGLDARPGTQSVGNIFFRRRFGAYGQLSYDRVYDDVHHITGSLLAYGSNFKQQGNFQGVKQAHTGLQITYTFDQKYMVDFSSAYVNSVKLAEGNRGAFSPSLGLAWMISSENFMSSISNIDFLKLRLSGGIINSDLPIGGFYYYDNRYGGSGGYNWYEGTRNRSGVRSNWSNNPNLGFAKRKEVAFGFEGSFFNQRIGIEANTYYNAYTDLVTRPRTKYPDFYSDFIPYENFGADRYKGAELGVTYNKSFGDWSVSVGVNALYVTSERVKVDEVYDNDYQYRKGHPRDASFGLEAIGLFQDQADIENSPIQAFGNVQPGDIKYRDMNGDGIVDANDEVYLRRWQAPLSGGIQLKVSYKNLSLFALGEGRSGADDFMEGNYFWVDGNKKYSEVVVNSWTPETSSTATYPRLSSGANNNNHRRSSYWLYSNDYFQLRRVQLTYNIPESVTGSLLMRNVDVFLDATDVFQIAKNKKIRDLRVGGEPNYSTFSMGVKASF